MTYRRPNDRAPLYDEPAPGPSLFGQILTVIVYFLLALAVGSVVLAIGTGGLVTIEDSPAAEPSRPQPTAAPPTPRPQPTQRPAAAPASQPIPIIPPVPDPALQPGEIVIVRTPTPAIVELVATVVIEQPPIATDTPPWIMGEPGTFPTPATAADPPAAADPPPWLVGAPGTFPTPVPAPGAH